MELAFLTKKRLLEQNRFNQYLLKDFFATLNAVSKYEFEVFSTYSDTDVFYDALVCLRDKSTQTILQWFICKINYDPDQSNFIYKTDYKKLNKSKYKFINDSFSQIYRPLYINFTSKNTVLYSLDEIELVESKVNGRKVYLLDESKGKVKNFIYNSEDHHTELLLEKDIIEEEIKKIYEYLNDLEEYKINEHIKERNKLPRV